VVIAQIALAWLLARSHGSSRSRAREAEALEENIAEADVQLTAGQPERDRQRRIEDQRARGPYPEHLRKWSALSGDERAGGRAPRRQRRLMTRAPRVRPLLDGNRRGAPVSQKQN